MQSGSGGVQRNHNIVSIDAELHRIGSSGLLKPTEVVYLLQAGNNCLFNNRLTVRDAEELGFQRPSSLNWKGVFFADIIFKRDLLYSLKQLFETARFKSAQHQLDTFSGTQTNVCSGNHALVTFKGDSAVGDL